MSHGVVIGKFYPPHLGHNLLIEKASEQSSSLTVVVMASSQESLSLATRVSLLKKIHTAPWITIVGIMAETIIDLDSEPIWEFNVQAIKHAVKNVTDKRIDYLYTSEGYGEELANRLGAEHRVVDLNRISVPVSGTLIRKEPQVNWKYLHPVVQSKLANRIVVVGAESTGTTTISKMLAEHYKGSAWIGEYGRQYTFDFLDEIKKSNPEAGMEDLVWTGPDFAKIGIEQNRQEEEATKESNIVICDTDAWATRLWEYRYLGLDGSYTASAVPDEAIAPRLIYFVTSEVGVPFEQDGIRDGEHIRVEMTKWFLDKLTKDGLNWVLLTGTLEERFNLAVEVVDNLLALSALADPIGERNPGRSKETLIDTLEADMLN
jgi:HTH-type transcriptional repressor of NAD biosynthesis genes